ncbi:MAG: condensation domain-containing protein [Methanotrichaceae archaeon]
MNQTEQMNRSTNIPGCIRRLWNGERNLLWGPGSSVAVATRIIGNVSEKDLTRVLCAVRRMHPLVGAKVIFDDQHDAWFSTDKVPETIFRIVPRTSDTQWFDEIQREHRVPFEIEIGPLIRFVLVYSSPVSELIAFAQHSICDGVALANLIRDILIFYADPAKEINVIEPPLSTSYLQSNGGSSPSSKSIGSDAINNLNIQWRQRPHYFSQADFIEVHKAYWKKMQHNIVLLQLEPEETSRLVSKCRERGVTIISATTAAFMAAYQDVVGPFPAGQNIVTIPYDLRRRLPENIRDAFCLFVGASAFPITFDNKKDIWENAQEIHKIIHKDLERLNTAGLEIDLFDPTLIDASFGFAPLVKLVPEAFETTKNLSAFAHDRENIAFVLSGSFKAAMPAIINTNLGNLNYPVTYGNLKLDRMFFTPGASKDIPLLPAGIGLNGKLEFTLNYAKDMKEGDGSPLDRDMISIRNRTLELLGFPEKANERAI